MGGANNPAKKINFEALKEEQTKVQEPVFRSTSVKEPPKTEKPDAQGYRPGERFKQLKEQEARRKQKKLVEKAQEISVTNEAIRGDTKVDHELEVDSIQRNQSLNGDPSSSDSNQVEKTLISKMEDDGDSVRYSRRRDQQKHGRT